MFRRSAVKELLIALEFKSANKWDDDKVIGQIKKLPAILKDEPPKAELSKGQSRLLKKLLTAAKNKDEIELEDDEETETEKPAKEGKAKKGGKKAKTAKDEEEDDEEEDDEEEDDEEDDDDDEEEEEDEEDEEEEEDEKPKKKKDKKDATDKKKKPAVKRAEGPGVIGSIVEFLGEATEKKPLSKKELIEKLAKRFKDREPEKMGKTVQVQVPGRLREEKGLNVQKNDKGFWIAAGKKKKTKAKGE